MSAAQKPDAATLQWMTANIAHDAKLGLSLHSYEGVIAARLMFVRTMQRRLDARTDPPLCQCSRLTWPHAGGHRSGMPSGQIFPALRHRWQRRAGGCLTMAHRVVFRHEEAAAAFRILFEKTDYFKTKEAAQRAADLLDEMAARGKMMRASFKPADRE